MTGAMPVIAIETDVADGDKNARCLRFAALAAGGKESESVPAMACAAAAEATGDGVAVGAGVLMRGVEVPDSPPHAAKSAQPAASATACRRRTSTLVPAVGGHNLRRWRDPVRPGKPNSTRYR